MAEELEITTAGRRVTIVGGIRTAGDREGLRSAVAKALEDPIPGEVVLDVARSGYLDTATLVLLISLARMCTTAKTTLAIENANEDLLLELHVSHIDAVLRTRGVRIAKASA